MKKLSHDEFAAWSEAAKVLEEDRYGVKVLHLVDGTFLKLFRRKSWFSKTTLFPPAKRFAANAAELQRLGIRCPVVLGLYQMTDPYRSIVHYQPLEGITLRQLLNEQPTLEQIELFADLASFITTLHDLGVYFRSLHLGNIVKTPDGALGLIDISDMRCLGKPLSKWMRRRNYQHLLRYEDDWALVHPQIRDHFHS
ncbi:toluene tolerance protein [Halopseudomonas pelagia]|uniref:Toluene tolerance protein n=1 Tax=Halopseudomonas pelagia TaxID=553151 RepID=A0AA91Z4A7_9GAMM|nr:toluene tolerance protein [Halopseudomonas pelagia]PCC97712.1 toluene tolerance protein [Halopseudomonas pelagia]QFY58027.1 toluene tolerance protein [Halopseudomonas pelagia]